MTAEFSVAVVRREFMAENKYSVFRSRDINIHNYLENTVRDTCKLMNHREGGP